MSFIFSYGTLQQESVQLSTFGRTVECGPDKLVGYERVSLTLANPDIVAATGTATHANIVCRDSSEFQVPGSCLSVTDNELALCDRYERLADYRRTSVALESGKQAWVYTFAGRSTGGKHQW